MLMVIEKGITYLAENTYLSHDGLTCHHLVLKKGKSSKVYPVLGFQVFEHETDDLGRPGNWITTDNNGYLLLTSY